MISKRKLWLIIGLISIVLIILAVLWQISLHNNDDASNITPKTIRILTIGETSQAALERVSDALSEITMERLGCRIELQMLREAEYDDRIDDLLLESNFADIFVCRNRTTMNKLLDGNYIYRLDRYLKDYPQFMQAVSNEQAWAQTKEQEHIYAIPFGNDSSYRWGFVMRRDICQQLNINPTDVTTLDELYQVLLRVKETYPNIVPVVSNHGQMNTFAASDLLSGSGGFLISDNEITDICSIPEFSRRCEIMRQWYKEKLILSNAPQNTEGYETWIAEKMAFGAFAQIGRYTQRELEYMMGTQVSCSILEESFFGDYMSDMSFAVYSYTEDVDLCLRVLSLIYTDPQVLQLCIYGQEGIDYELSNSGCAVPSESVAQDDRYINWCWPLRDSAVLPLETNDPWWYKQTDNTDKQAVYFDNRKVFNEVYQCGEILKKYYEALCSGMIDPTEGIAMMRNELAAAYADVIREELERQLG